MLWTRPESADIRRWTGTTAWVLLVFALMVLIGCGLARTTFSGRAPEPVMLEDARGRGRAGRWLSSGMWGILRAQVVSVGDFDYERPAVVAKS